MPRYALAAVEREGQQILRDVRLFCVPAEAIGGESSVRDSLVNEALEMLGQDSTSGAIKTGETAAQLQLVEDLQTAIEAGDEELVAKLEAEYAALSAKLADDEHRDVKRRHETRTSNMTARDLAATKKFLGAK